jgi:hydrogenase maturation protease
MGKKRILVIGYGNPSRGDDGLGPAIAARLEALQIPGLSVESDYQLSIEHAALAAEHDIVVFADAARDAEMPFYFRPVAPIAAPAGRLGTHSITPAEVLFLALSCFHAAPQGFLLGIHAPNLGCLEEGLSPAAQQSMEAALEHLQEFIASVSRAGCSGVPPHKPC